MNQWRHVAVTLAGSVARIYVNGVEVAQNTGFGINPATFSPRVNYLGKSQWPADPHFNGMLDEVLITDYALSAAQVGALLTNTPPAFATHGYFLPPGTNGVAYGGSLASLASDVDPGDMFVFSRATGPAWLNIAADGTLSGTPTTADGGTNWFTMRVTDVAGESRFAVAAVPVLVLNASGTWISDATGPWSATNRWHSNTVAVGPGQTANFSTININGNRTVVLDGSRSIGALRFSDTASTLHDWSVVGANNSVLTLDSGSSAPPAIVVTNTATLAVPLDGANGFTRSGPGTLILAGNNSISGTVNIDTGSSSANDGITRLAGPNALGNASLIQIRNNNSGFSTLQLDGSSGSISVDADVSVTCRNNGVVSIGNLAGTNVFNGDILLNVGGNSHTVQSDASSLIVFTGTNKYVGSLTNARTYYFTGAGDHLLIGPLLSAANGAPIALVKTGAGTLTLEADNTYGNGTTLGGGRLMVNGTLPSGTFSLSNGTTLGGSGTIHPAFILPSGATLAPGASIGRLTVNNAVCLQAGSVTRMEITKAASTNTHDQLRVFGPVTYGGTLEVTQLGGTLWAGDAFQLFKASSYGSAFAATNFPALTGGLAWRFDAANGVVAVVEPGVNGVPPAAPFALIASAGDAVVNLTWAQSPTAEVVTNRIYRSTSGSAGPFNLLAAVPATVAYSDTAVVNHQTWHYVVSAVSVNGESAPSGVASATPPDVFGPPAVPQDLSATPGDAQVTLGWSLVNGASRYNVKRVGTLGSAFTIITNVSAADFTDTGLVNGATYYYAVSALNAAGESVNSQAVSARPWSPLPPPLGFVQVGDEIQLSWPAEHTGWELQVQTNNLANGLGAGWLPVPGSQLTNELTRPIDPIIGSVFYRLVSPQP